MEGGPPLLTSAWPVGTALRASPQAPASTWGRSREPPEPCVWAGRTQDQASAAFCPHLQGMDTRRGAQPAHLVRATHHTAQWGHRNQPSLSSRPRSAASTLPVDVPLEAGSQKTQQTEEKETDSKECHRNKWTLLTDEMTVYTEKPRKARACRTRRGRARREGRENVDLSASGWEGRQL